MLTFLALFLGCSGPKSTQAPAPMAALDLIEPLESGQVRAGVVTDPAALFGGISAEGRPGDIKLYNDRVRFVVQGLRQSTFYVDVGGTVVDADITRPAGLPGHDIIDELTPMFGLGRVMMPTDIEVVSDGSDGAAVVRVTGVEAPLGLIEGALEAPGFVPHLGLTMVTEYRLLPDSWLLEVQSTVTGGTTPSSIGIGDLFIGAPEVARTWAPGGGLESGPLDPFVWTGFMSDTNDVAVALIAPAGEPLTTSGYELLTELADMAIGFGPVTEFDPGESLTWTRYYGVAPDTATLSDAALALQGGATTPLTGTVDAPDGPVAGARVNVLVDDRPFAVAVTDADGLFALDVPAGANTAVIADGRGTGLFTDLPSGAGAWSPYADPAVQAVQLASLTEGADARPPARGRGVGTAEAPLSLGEPATLTVQSADGRPFAVRVAPTEPDAAIDARVIQPRPDGLAAAGWSRDGTIELAVEPGTYEILALRGMRYEVDTVPVTLAPGEQVTVDVSLPAAFDHSGWTIADPHMHASPSADGEITMADRLVVSAALGIQVHFGTDHDHVADYRPLVEALGLGATLRSVVADEVSPPMRGHFNIYPIEPIDAPNGGAWTWWTDIPEDTETMVAALRQRHGDGFTLQANHPTDAGIATLSDWTPGNADADRWTTDLGAIEVLNAGSYDEFLAFYLDLLQRGYVTTPTGVSDSHGYFSSSIGLSTTFFGTGSAVISDWSDDALREALAARRTVVSRGVFLATSLDPGSEVSAGAAVEVEARSASWARVDRLSLLRDGLVVETVDGDTATFVLDPEVDATYFVIAEGDAPMAPLSSRTPWAMTSAWRVDADGNGWSAPLAPLTLE